MGNPITSKVTIILSVRFALHARTLNKKQSTTELRATTKNVEHPQGVTLDEDPQGRGVWVDEKLLVPWANILWAEYA